MEDTVVKCDTTDFLNLVTKIDSDGNEYVVISEKQAPSLSSKILNVMHKACNWVGSIIL